MPRYSLTFDDVATPAVADQLKTVLGLIAGSAGERGRLVSLAIGPSNDTPADLNLHVEINRTDQSTAGTSTSVTPAKLDTESRASDMAAGRNFTVEPTAFETEPLWMEDVNSRGAFIVDFLPSDATRWKNGETLCLRVASRAATAQQISGTLVWEEY